METLFSTEKFPSKERIEKEAKAAKVEAEKAKNAIKNLRSNLNRKVKEEINGSGWSM